MPALEVSVQCDGTQWGEQVAVLGSFNEWDKEDLRILSTCSQSFPIWRGKIQVSTNPSQPSIEYKYIIEKSGQILRWETECSRNRILSIAGDTAAVFDTFGYIPLIQNSPKSSSPLLPVQSDEENSQPPSYTYDEFTEDSSSLDGLEQKIVQLHGERRSWRQRLTFIRSLFTEPAVAGEAEFDSASVHNLATVAIYLTFLSNGQVQCDEDGGHYRPNHHAMEARKIEAALSKVMYSVESPLPMQPTTQNYRRAYIPYIVRKIFPQLPSYSSQFTVSVPLTRIRDIAHRSDIPHDLKQEIKHTLQNKLHRCAGPEDLKTSEMLLRRVSNGGYSEQFVEQFRLFHSELQMFFNSASLDDRLSYLQSAEHSRLVSSSAFSLLSLKTNNGSPHSQLQMLTKLRDGISKLPLMRSSREGHGYFLPDEDTQKTRLTDIDLETHAFVQIALIAKDMESDSSDSESFPWNRALEVLELAIENMRLSSIRPSECTAIAAELSALRGVIGTTNRLLRDLAFRLKAAVDRVMRFVQTFSDTIADVYGQRVSTIGQALNVEKRAISVFAESEIRSNITFQTSRIATALAKACRHVLSLPPWDALRAGEVRGSIIYVNSLSEVDSEASSGNGDDKNDALIVVCKTADGDEDVPPRVKGIVTGRTLPHLSHIGVRARQANVVFVCAEERSVFEEIWNRRLRGSVILSVTAWDGLKRLEETKVENLKQNGWSNETNGANPTKSGSKAASASSIHYDSETSDVMPVVKASREAVSAKAYFAGLLKSTADDSNGLFCVPESVVLPHGSFQVERKRHSEKYNALVHDYESTVKNGGDSSAVSAAAARIADFIRDKFTPQRNAIFAIRAALPSNSRVMVRSSANAEDLETMSGAGLYDTIANVAISEPEHIKRAIKNVWASLWTARAAASRASFGVPNDSISMAVLVQRMVRSSISFVAFSYDPVSNGDDIYVEMAIGMGETLASASDEGSPYRFCVERGTFAVKTISFASYSHALLPSEDTPDNEENLDDNQGLHPTIIDYSKERLTIDDEWRKDIVARIAKIVVILEEGFSSPQDVEGGITVEDGKSQIYIVQARPQIILLE